MSSKTCAICLEDVNDLQCVLTCRHVFHSDCLIRNVSYAGDTRCPTCRTTIADKRSKDSLADLSINELGTAIDDEFRELRRLQTNYDARKRRIVNNNPSLRRDQLCVRELEREIRALNNDIEDTWKQEQKAFMKSPACVAKREKRTKIMHKLRRHSKRIEMSVEETIGVRPDFESGHRIASTTIARMIAGANAAAAASL